MRAPLLALALLLPLLSPTSGAAGEPVLTDPEGDAQWTITTPTGPLPGAPSSSVESTRGCDLLSLAVDELDDALLFKVAVASLSGDPQGTAIQLLMDWHGKEYRASFGYFATSVSTSEGGAFAYLESREGDGWDFVARLDPPAVSTEAAEIAVHVPKVYLLDAQQRLPGRGDTLGITRVLTDAVFTGMGFGELRVRDAMPDEEGKGVELTMQRGDFATGSIVLGSDTRVRVSNGGATTFVFPATLRNPSDATQEYALTVPDLPAGWNVTLPASLRVAADAEKTIQLLVSVPFAHEHGGFSGFNLTVKGVTDTATEARMRMGVLHTPIPQPAGHHSELYLHADSAFDGPTGGPFAATVPYAWGWMNTLADHADDAEHVTPSNGGGESTDWFVALNPRLQMGLDFDLERSGALEGAILGGRIGEVEVTADLYYWANDDPVLLAEGAPVTVTLDTQAETPFSITLTPTLESDYIAYEPESYMYLHISMTGSPHDALSNPTRAKLVVEPFKLALPLNEYHDKLTGETEAAQSVEIVALGPVEKAGLPGSVLTYPFTVKNVGAPQVLTFEVAGNGAHTARVIPGGDVFLDSGETREVLLGVEIPVRANPGEEIEALLFVHARDDPTQMAVARTKTRVTVAPAEAAPDETGELLAAQARENQTPSPAWLVVLAGLVALALRRR